MKKTLSNRQKRLAAAEAIQRITERVYANDGVTAGQVYRVIRDHHRTIMDALDPEKRVPRTSRVNQREPLQVKASVTTNGENSD
jgi:hypothetical protein